MRVILFLVTLLSLVSCANQFRGADPEIVSGFDVRPNTSLLVVKVGLVESTGLYPPLDCPVHECIPFYFWYVYEAEVLEAVAGDFAGSAISFAALQHTFWTKGVTDEWYILVEDLDEETAQELGVQYRVVAHDYKTPELD
jgi:hypothetical protein